VSNVPIDAYVLDTLMRDLVAHDRSASSFLVYVHLYRRSFGAAKDAVRVSHQRLADATGLSKSAVQAAVRNLTRRKLVRVSKASATAIPEYAVLRPWRREGAGG
jgi:DNA-binding GntR family transcriptional regulator